MSAKQKNFWRVFNDSLQCPVKLQEIEIYLQILMPIFDFNLGLQGSRSSICDVVTGLLNLINRFSKFVLDARASELCYFLVHFLKLKFDYELNSPIYMVDIWRSQFLFQKYNFKKILRLLPCSKFLDWILD